eukprot:313276-Chlamydomonas_euryale.AAC.1
MEAERSEAARSQTASGVKGGGEEERLPGDTWMAFLWRHEQRGLAPGCTQGWVRATHVPAGSKQSHSE